MFHASALLQTLRGVSVHIYSHSHYKIIVYYHNISRGSELFYHKMVKLKNSTYS